MQNYAAIKNEDNNNYLNPDTQVQHADYIQHLCKSMQKSQEV